MLNASNDPAFCNSCHIMEPCYYESWDDSNLLANKHAAEGEDAMTAMNQICQHRLTKALNM